MEIIPVITLIIQVENSDKILDLHWPSSKHQLSKLRKEKVKKKCSVYLGIGCSIPEISMDLSER